MNANTATDDAGAVSAAGRLFELSELSNQLAVRDARHAFKAHSAPWILEQNMHHDRNGLWCEGLVVWPQETT